MALASIICAGLLWVARSHPAAQSSPPRARAYREYTSCLLTDNLGINAKPASTVWSGMQDASAATRTKVQYLAIAGPQTIDNAKTFAASLAQSHCGQILAVGTLPTEAAAAMTTRFPDTHFVIIATTPAAGLGFMPTVPESSLPERVANEIQTASAGQQ